MNPDEVAVLIRAVLEDEDVELDDNFFDIGGNSLLAIELISVLKDRTGVALALIDLIGDPTAEGISRLLAEAAS